MLLQMLFWVVIYSFILAFSQVLLKLGLDQVGSFSVHGTKQLFDLALALISNGYVLSGVIMTASSFFLWMTILSWFKLSLALPLTSLSFVFVAVLSYFMLNEKLLLYNYLGIALIAAGTYLLLLKQV